MFTKMAQTALISFNQVQVNVLNQVAKATKLQTPAAAANFCERVVLQHKSNREAGAPLMNGFTNPAGVAVTNMYLNVLAAAIDADLNR